MNKRKEKFLNKENIWKKELKSFPDRDYNFNTLSGKKLDPLYYPDNSDMQYIDKLGFPGQYPYTRGVHANMYRGKLWTMRQFSGYGSPEESNKRYHYLLNQGQTGLSIAYDMPTLMGYDPDHPISLGEVGKCGVSVASLNDMEMLLKGVDLSKVSISQTINGPAIILLAFYIALAQKQDVPLNELRGTLQNDILKEFTAQKEWIFPPLPSMRIITDMLSYCTKEMPKYNTISISGYHIREAGSTAAQELAFTLADGFTYIEFALKAGLKIDDFAPRLSFFFNSHLDFFEEIAKFRAARRIWARHLKEKYGAKKESSLKLRFHAQTAGCSLTAQQPENNISRTAFQAIAAVLGGAQSLHTNSMDETLALPSEKAAEIALRTQQLIAYETGVANVADPLGGSWFVESLTDQLERDAENYFEDIEKNGGVIQAIEDGYFQREIAKSAEDYQKLIDEKQLYVVGVNKFNKDNENIDIPILEIGPEVEKERIKSINKLKNNRDETLVQKSLNYIQECCKNKDNIMPAIINAAKSNVTLGEIVTVMKVEFGEWQEASAF
ncbi:MAG: methylmalonyl-CoA mutase family protein [Candidatus Neomarinimicrobiota bacterium]|nr:methylmalonyl-CoA mutase [Candidatus Neomarinimicrobiota bacterium]MEC9027439.1 methylmalonyl-CoA mutase family protein [Candidatus Neomarinimicrobiota bacterium]MEC9105825.1 methylmalonyl-CoA mutase family protein [Candidatus Neomarinimicrobiota bacterium]|tara:strand:+ start:587 stop:2245 length:1659 start_codon:yes stop_codon:yes gene_type:complete